MLNKRKTTQIVWNLLSCEKHPVERGPSHTNTLTHTHTPAPAKTEIFWSYTFDVLTLTKFSQTHSRKCVKVEDKSERKLIRKRNWKKYFYVPKKKSENIVLDKTSSIIIWRRKEKQKMGKREKWRKIFVSKFYMF